MPFSVSSFFAGVGTVLCTVAIGFGGGIVLTDAFTGKGDTRESSKLQQQGGKAKSTSQTAPASVAAERPTVQQAVSIQQPAVAEPAPQTTAVAIPPAAPQARPEDAQAKATGAEIQRELKRQEHVKRAEQRKAMAERKRRKDEAMRAIAERTRREEATKVAEGGRQEEPRQGDDDNPFGRLFRTH